MLRILTLRVLIRVIFVIGLTLISCQNKVQTSQEYELSAKHIQIRPIHIQVDKKFDQVQRASIAKAFAVWEDMSDHKIKFVVEWDRSQPSRFSNHHLEKDGGIFLWSLTKDELNDSQKDDWSGYIGLTQFGSGNNSANVIVFNDCGESHFYAVALHELGHLIGLNHIPNKFSVMSPHVSAYCITEYDADQLCDLYGCRPHPECRSLDAAAENWVSIP